MAFDPRRLAVLRAIAEHRSLTRAAETLAMSQPAVSRQLAALERELGGIELVTRGPRHVSVTPAGAALLEEADAILPAIDAASRRLSGFRSDDGGAVRLGAVPSAMAAFVPDALRALRGERPRAEIAAEEGWSTDLARLIARGNLDIAIISTPASVAMPADTLLREPFYAMLPAGHPLGRHAQLELGQLADEPWVVASDPAGRLPMLTACARAGFTPRIVASASWDAAEALIATGLGVTMVPRSTAARVQRPDAVAARLLADVPERELLMVGARRAQRMPVELALERRLREAAAEFAKRPVTGAPESSSSLT
jgi:DNA-binding transcriptional LysR family regulator